eukprot:symbB.v1.2.024234.t1/scaffold2279.1/size83532/1
MMMWHPYKAPVRYPVHYSNINLTKVASCVQSDQPVLFPRHQSNLNTLKEQSLHIPSQV